MVCLRRRALPFSNRLSQFQADSRFRRHRAQMLLVIVNDRFGICIELQSNSVIGEARTKSSRVPYLAHRSPRSLLASPWRVYNFLDVVDRRADPWYDPSACNLQEMHNALLSLIEFFLEPFQTLLLGGDVCHEDGLCYASK